MKKRTLCIILVCIAVVLLGAYEIVGLRGLGIELDEPLGTIVGMMFTRGLGGLVFALLLWYLEYRVMNPVQKPFWKSILFCMPAFAVVINNLHIYTLIRGQERVTSPVYMVLLLFFECLCIGLFEEMAFRGVVFLKILEGRRRRTSDIVVSILLSSAVFAVVHAVNFIYSSPLYVIQQIGYSFLIGAMCSVVLVRTRNIWLCVVLHGVFNFGGSLVPTLGEGFVWDVPTIAVTVIIAVATTVYMTVSLIRMPMEELCLIYSDSGNKA